MNPELEPTIKELQELGKLAPLKDEKRERARYLMSQLRKWGFTNREIAALSLGSWSEQTIKQEYLSGVSVESPEVRERAIDVLAQLASRDMSLDVVDTALLMKADLEDRSISFDELGSFIQLTTGWKLPVNEIGPLVSEIRRSRLSADQMLELARYKEAFSKAGLELTLLPTLAETLKMFGNAEDLLKAVNAHESLVKLTEKIQKSEEELAGLQRQDKELSKKISGLETTRKSIEGELRLYQSLVKMGFYEKSLRELLGIAARLGGLKATMQGLSTFESLEALKGTVAEYQANLKKAKAELEETEGKYARRMTVIKLADVLQYEFGMTKDAISDLLKLARKYGDPNQIIDALLKYGEVKHLEEQIRKLQATAEELDGRKVFLEKELTKLQGLLQEVKDTADGILLPFSQNLTNHANELGVAFGGAIESMTGAYELTIRQFGEVKAEMGKLEHELQLARNILAILHHPEQMKDVPTDTIRTLTECAQRLARAKGFNPKAKVSESLRHKQLGIQSYVELELVDALGWALRCLTPPEQRDIGI